MGIFSFLSMLNPLPELGALLRDPLGVNTATLYTPPGAVNGGAADILEQHGIECWATFETHGVQVLHVHQRDGERAAAVLLRNGVTLTHPY